MLPEEARGKAVEGLGAEHVEALHVMVPGEADHVLHGGLFGEVARGEASLGPDKRIGSDATREQGIAMVGLADVARSGGHVLGAGGVSGIAIKGRDPRNRRGFIWYMFHARRRRFARRGWLPHRYVHHGSGGEHVLSSKQVGIIVAPGDVFEMLSSGGGGWGDLSYRSEAAADRLDGIA